MKVNAGNVRLDGTLSISRMTGGRHDDYRGTIGIELRDNTSGMRFLNCEISLADMMAALTGLSGSPMKFDLAPAVVGLKIETKMEIVAKIGDGRQSDESIFVRPYEQDGWMYQNGYGNHHRSSHSGFKCSFRRFVDSDGKPFNDVPYQVMTGEEANIALAEDWCVEKFHDGFYIANRIGTAADPSKLNTFEEAYFYVLGEAKRHAHPVHLKALAAVFYSRYCSKFAGEAK